MNNPILPPLPFVAIPQLTNVQLTLPLLEPLYTEWFPLDKAWPVRIGFYEIGCCGEVMGKFEYVDFQNHEGWMFPPDGFEYTPTHWRGLTSEGLRHYVA